MQKNNTLQYKEYPPVSGSQPKQVVIMLHGYGSNASDLITLAPELSQFLPDATFISPNAPEPYESDPVFGGYQWFSLQHFDEAFMLQGARQAAVILNSFIDEQLARLRLQESNLALLGFSQGTMMALFVGLRRKHQLAGLLCYSGILLGEDLLQSELGSKPPVMLIHGVADQVVLPIYQARSKKVLEQLQVPVHTLLRPRLGHGIDQEGISSGGQFLRGVFII